MSDKIKSKFTTALEMGQWGHGIKIENNTGLALGRNFTFNTHSEFKGGLGKQHSLGGTASKPQDLLARGIYADKWGAPFLKQLSLAWKPTPELTLSAGFDDMGRNRTTNGFKAVGAADLSDISRNPSIPFIERPLVNNFPGSNLSVVGEYVGSAAENTFRFFAGAGGGRKSAGIFGVEKRTYTNDPKTDADETTIQVIKPVDDDGAFIQGGFYTLGGDFGLKLAPKFLLAVSANLSLRSFHDVGAKQKGFNKKATEAGAVLNPYLGVGLEAGPLSVFGDASWVIDSGDGSRNQLGLRAAARGHVYKTDKTDISLQVAVASVAAGQGAVISEDQIVYADPESKETQVIGPEGPVIESVLKGGGRRNAFIVGGGIDVKRKLAHGSIGGSATMGYIEDSSKLSDGSTFFGIRLLFEHSF